MTAPALEVAALTVRFRTRMGTVTALSSVDLRLEPGQFGVVVGESGSGKSVLAHALLRLLPANAEISGSVHMAGRDVLAASPLELRELRGQRAAFVPQSPGSALNPVRRVGRLLAELARVRGIPPSQVRATLHDALATFDLDLDEIAGSYPHQLSGGMQQRVVNSLALVGRPALVIADEPTSGLDAALVDATAAQLERIAERGAAVLVITHDLDLAERLSGRLLLLYASYLVEESPTGAFFASPAHPYGTALLAARPQRGGQPIPGRAPELTALPDHCPFQSRCRDRLEVCAQRIPGAYPAPGGSVRCFLHDGALHAAG